MRKLLPLFFILAFVAAAFAQTPPSLTIDELKAKAKRLKVKGDVIISYNKFRDRGQVMSKPRNLVGTWEGVGAIMATGGYGRAGTARVIMIAIESVFPGQKLVATPDKFALVFDTMNANFMFLKGSRTLYILFDDERLELDVLGHDADIKAGFMTGGPRVEEKFAYMLTREQVEKLAAAKKVEFMVSGNEEPRIIKPDIRKDWQSVLDVTKLD